MYPSINSTNTCRVTVLFQAGAAGCWVLGAECLVVGAVEDVLLVPSLRAAVLHVGPEQEAHVHGLCSILFGCCGRIL